MSKMDRWRGKNAIVTGASSGIGRAVALALSKAGMRVALAARRADRLEELKADIEAFGTEALSLPADLRDESDILRALDTVRSEWGGIDVLVNSAGIGRIAPLSSGETALFREMLDVNVLALMIATREAVKDMRSRDADGHIIHISSMSAHRIQAGSGLYAATKHAVRALTEGLRLELREMKSGIRVTSISPADTESEFWSSLWGSEVEAEKHKPTYRIMDAYDVADAILYVLGTPPHVEVHDLLLRPIDQPD